MATFEIPTRNDIYIYEFQAEQLDGEIYPFRVHYNRRMDRWVVDIPNAVYNIPLVGGTDLLKQFHHIDGVPPGELKIVDLDGLNRDAGETTFSDRIVLGYKEA